MRSDERPAEAVARIAEREAVPPYELTICRDCGPRDLAVGAAGQAWLVEPMVSGATLPVEEVSVPRSDQPPHSKLACLVPPTGVKDPRKRAAPETLNGR